MNTKISFLPDRPAKPRNSGLTMMMDKGLSLNEAHNFIDSSAEFTDLVKFGFGTAIFAKQVEEKIKAYRQADLEPYFGGTLFEAFIVRNKFDDFRSFITKMGMETVEVSDGSMRIEPNEKLEYVRKLSKDFRVLSEVGSKVKGVEIPHEVWVQFMKNELEAGAWKVIAEARESGTIGIYNSDGSANIELVNDILETVKGENVLWEAPIKNQQHWFIDLLGANVNLGNIAPAEVVALEALRLGLRGDTFFNFLPKELQGRKL
ncbi:MAG: phosphosulfolactate synthase [Bacteroidales bacterium]|nr:phosphosulfolactate synthase [Bacteroidales bacterium]MCF8389507.1 phosphosulfolactate synthase [Bacteroidales bacterium]